MNDRRGLLIRAPYIQYILAGKKIIEFRGSRTTIRGTIALIESGSGLIKGTAELYDVEGPNTLEEYNERAKANMGEGKPQLPYQKTYGWLLRNVEQDAEPIPYVHPQGAVIWVKLNDIVNTCDYFN